MPKLPIAVLNDRLVATAKGLACSATAECA